MNNNETNLCKYCHSVIHASAEFCDDECQEDFLREQKEVPVSEDGDKAAKKYVFTLEKLEAIKKGSYNKGWSDCLIKYDPKGKQQSTPINEQSKIDKAIERCENKITELRSHRSLEQINYREAVIDMRNFLQSIK